MGVLDGSSEMRLDFASALLALWLVLPGAPVRAQDDEQPGAADESSAGESAPEAAPACAAQVGKKTASVVAKCEGETGAVQCAVYNPIRSNLCEAQKTAGDLTVHYDYFGKTDCRTNTAARALSDVDRVVIHNGGWNARHNFDTFSCRQGASHYSIQRDGAIYQHVGEELVSWHAAGPAATDKRINERSIGIELNLPQEVGYSCNSLPKAKQNEADVRKGCAPTDAQYESLKSLLDAIAARTSVTLDEDHVIGHCEGQNPGMDSAHGDPRAFDWSRIGLSNEKKKELGGKACQWYID
jgi:N-acetyl-anhydromuramyl-L-alanine amidase AmpD